MSAPGVVTDTMANIRTAKDASGKEYTYKVQPLDVSKLSGSAKAKYYKKIAMNNETTYLSKDAKLNKKPFILYLQYIYNSLKSIGEHQERLESYPGDSENLKLYDYNIRLQDRYDSYFQPPEDAFEDLYNILKALQIDNFFDFNYFYKLSYKEAVAIFGKDHIDETVNYYNDEEERVNKKTLVVVTPQIRISTKYGDYGGRSYLDASKKLKSILP